MGPSKPMSRSLIRGAIIALAFGAMLYMCALPGELPVSVDTTDGLAGTYTANGLNPNGSEFGGTAVFTATSEPDVFDFQLIITGSIQQGRAVRSGNNVMITWSTVSSASDETITGTADYVIAADGGLDGEWRVDADTGTGAGTRAQATGTIELFPEP